MAPIHLQPPPQWDLAALADDVADALADHAAARIAEQAPDGVDDLDEPALHALLAEGLTARGYHVQREVPYPADAARPAARRRRCDLRLRRPACGPKPFRLRQGYDGQDGGRRPAAGGLDPLWLEVKRSWQFADGESHRGYAAQWLQHTVADVRKLRADEGIDRAALLLIAFAADAETFAHDLSAFQTACARKAAPLPPGHTAARPLPDRIGHTLAAATVWRVR